MSRSLVLLCLAFALFIGSAIADVPPPSSTAGQGPQTSCSPVTIDAFGVLTHPGMNDTEGEFVGEVVTNYPQVYYYMYLPHNVSGSAIIFNVTLDPNAENLWFTIALNGVWHSTNGVIDIYTNHPSSEVIEFETGWLSSERGNVTNIVQLNVSQEIVVGPDHTTCSYVDIISINNPPSNPGTAGNVVGDPQFVGLRGQSFQVHGIDGAVYNLISDNHMQLNSRFTFLEGPRPCPVIPSTGRLSSACWSHPGSYLSELALKTTGGDRLSITAGSASNGFSKITLNGKVLSVGDASPLQFLDESVSGALFLNNTHEMLIRAGHFEVMIENNDGFVNLRQVYVAPKYWSSLTAHGLLGQTWRNRRYAGKIKEIEGDVDDYLIEDDNLFGDSFMYNKFPQL